MSEKPSQPDQEDPTPPKIGNEIKQELEEWRAIKDKTTRASTESKSKARSEVSEALSAPPPSKTIAEILTSSSIEFRDALQNIRGFLELLVSGKVTDERQAKQFLGIAYRESQYLSNRVSDLLIASLIETDKLRVKISALTFDKLLQMAIQEMTPAAMGKGLSFKTDAPSELPTLKGDEALLHQVLINLLDETIKDTPKDGQILIRIALQETNLLVQIAGFSGDKSVDPTSLALINDTKFHSVADLSLSMYVVEQIVKAHDGGISTTRTQEDTRVFNIVLPLQPTTRMRGKILIVEDNPHLALLIEFALEKEGFQVEVAYDGVEGIKKVKANPPDAIVLDVIMPEKDGYEVCAEIKADEKYADIPVLMLTAVASRVSSTHYSHREGMSMEAEDYLPKPASAQQILESVKRLLNL